MTQAMVIAYPEQTKLANNNTQYLFCDQLLVCPVTEEVIEKDRKSKSEKRGFPPWSSG